MEPLFILGLTLIAIAIYYSGWHIAYGLGKKKGYAKGWDAKERAGATVYEVEVPVRGTSNPGEHAKQLRFCTTWGWQRVNLREFGVNKDEYYANPHDEIVEVHDGRPKR